MSAVPGFETDHLFEPCVRRCRNDLDERNKEKARSACVDAWMVRQEEGSTLVVPTSRDRRGWSPAIADKAKAIVAKEAPKKGAAAESGHSKVQCQMNLQEMRDVLDVTPGGPGARVHHTASGSSTSSTSPSCDSTKRVLKTCFRKLDRALSTASGSSVSSSSGSSSSGSLSSSGSSLYGRAMREDYGNYYAANMQSMNGLHLYDLNEINECRTNLEQCEQSQHSLFLLDGVLLLTLVSLSFIGVLCIVCLCAVIIARYIPFNQRKSGHVTYQNADTEIENL